MIQSLSIKISPPTTLLAHSDQIMLLGSCFTEHMGKRLLDAKFRMIQNPNGILFNPLSVASAVQSYIRNHSVHENDLFYLNELWNHWEFHTRFSNVDRNCALREMNESLQQAHRMLQKADWLILTLGSAFNYHHNALHKSVANCHRAPASDFEKLLLPIPEIDQALTAMTDDLRSFNPQLKIVYTISPVRHIRDGVVDNNRSKARLIEAVHEQVARYENVFYFPAYELVIDVLRDYRYYDVDMVHPNFAATNIVWEQFVKSFMNEETQKIVDDMLAISAARNHKVRFPETKAHSDFKAQMLRKVAHYEAVYPYLDFTEERAYFGAE